MTELDEDLLPPSLREMTEAVGVRTTLAVVEHWGGTRLCVPHKVDGQHPLVRCLGETAARALVETYRGETLQIPRAAAALREALYQQITREYDNGVTAAELAREHRVTERWIFYIVARSRRAAESKQTNLF